VACVLGTEIRKAPDREIVALTSTRSIGDVNSGSNHHIGARCELDSHADTCVAGANTILISDSQKSVTVRPFSGEYLAMTNIPIGTVATAYTVPDDGRVVILIINQALYFGDRLKNTLLTPNQMRDYGIEVDDAPRQYVAGSQHSLYVPDSNLRIPLQLRGIFSFLESRKPTQQEMDECEHIVLTSDAPWEPCSVEFANREQEAVRSDRRVSLVDSGGNSTGQVHYIAYPSDTRTVAAAQRVLETFRSLTEIEFCETKLVDRLIACVNVASDDHCGDGLDGRADPDVYPDSDDFIRVVSGMTSSERKSALTPEVLSRRWNIGLDSAKRTLQVTTQKGVRTVLHPLTRRYRTRQSHLRFPTIRTKVYTDTMFSSVTSIRQYKCAQVFTTNTAYSRVYPLQS
jgi:hypothetical protein